MEEFSESAPPTESETKKVVNPRAEIDTSLPFESVKEAVDLFGGSGPWIPHHLFRLSAEQHMNEDLTLEEQAVQLERDLRIKEEETLHVLKELESAKRFVEGLKHNFMPEFSSFMTSPDHLSSEFRINHCKESLSLCPVLSPGSMFMELNKAKTNLNKTSIDLAVIQESVESLNKKIRKEKAFLLERTMRDQQPLLFGLEENGIMQKSRVSMVHEKQVGFETEQFKKMTEASRYEVMKAMAEIERTKNSIKMAEMRLNAAKKMEEAAKAVEAIALAESSSDTLLLNNCNGVTLSLDEYHSLTRKAQQVEEMCKTKFIDTNTIQKKKDSHKPETRILEKEHGNREVDVGICEDGILHHNVGRHHYEWKHNNPHSFMGKTPENGTLSMGDILGRKVILQDDIIVGQQNGSKEHTSLSQMLREQSRLILHPRKTEEDGNVENSYLVQRKRFGFIQVPISIRKTKKKAQPLNRK